MPLNDLGWSVGVEDGDFPNLVLEFLREVGEDGEFCECSHVDRGEGECELKDWRCVSFMNM